MSLRDLLFDISFQGNVTDLIRMDSAVDDVRDNTLEATNNISGMERATDDLGETTGRSGNIISDNWVAVTGAMVAVSAAAETITRKNAGLEESTKRLASSFGMTNDEVKGVALELTNVTFPLEDVTSLMESGRQQGIKSMDQLKEYATFWDTVGDATGLAGPELGKASVGLRAVGIAAGEEKQALAAFGYITENTSGDVSEFLTFLEKTGPQLREMGVDVNDSAALLGVLEHEFGMSGKVARTEFRKAVNESEGDLNVMLDTLGISKDKMAEYRNEVSNSSDIIQRNADIHAESYTVTEKLGQKISELGFKYGDTIRTVSNFAPVLTAIGPASKLVTMAQTSMATGLLSKVVPAFTTGIASTWAFTTALLANPITWVIVAVVALGAAIWALATDFGGVTTWIKEKVSSFTDFFKEKFAMVSDWFGEKVAGFKEMGKNIVDGIIGGITEKFTALKDKVTGLASGVGNWFKDKLGISSPSRVMIEAGLDTGEGVSVGLQKSMPKIKKSTDDMGGSISREYSPSSNISTRTTDGDFKPTLNIYVMESKGSKESVQALKQEWERLMAQYEKRNNLKFGGAMSG